MSRYELTILIKPEAKLEEIKKLVEAQGIKAETEKPLGLKNLVYPIAGVKSANFYQLVGEFEVEKIQSLIQKLKLQNDILRVLLVSAKAKAPDVAVEVKPVKVEKPAFAKATVGKPEETIISPPKVKPKKVPPPPKVKAEKPSVEKDIESEEERLRQLEEKLSDILKE